MGKHSWRNYSHFFSLHESSPRCLGAGRWWLRTYVRRQEAGQIEIRKQPYDPPIPEMVIRRYAFLRENERAFLEENRFRVFGKCPLVCVGECVCVCVVVYSVCPRNDDSIAECLRDIIMEIIPKLLNTSSSGVKWYSVYSLFISHFQYQLSLRRSAK